MTTVQQPQREPMFLISKEQLDEILAETIKGASWVKYHRDSILSRPHPQAPEQCPHWKDVKNLKSDFRDQIKGNHYCDLPTPEQAARAATLAAYNNLTDKIELTYSKNGVMNVSDLLDWIESLRQSTTATKEPRP
jgi:hypothetical protein